MRRTAIKAKRETPRRCEGRVTHERMKRRPSDKGVAERGHMDRIAAMPCCGCGAMGVQIHHVISDGFKRLTRDHRLILPLCPSCHSTGASAVHRIGTRAWNEMHGVEQHVLAAQLWSESIG